MHQLRTLKWRICVNQRAWAFPSLVSHFPCSLHSDNEINHSVKNTRWNAIKMNFFLILFYYKRVVKPCIPSATMRKLNQAGGAQTTSPHGLGCVSQSLRVAAQPRLPFLWTFLYWRLEEKLQRKVWSLAAEVHGLAFAFPSFLGGRGDWFAENRTFWQTQLWKCWSSSRLKKLRHCKCFFVPKFSSDCSVSTFWILFACFFIATHLVAAFFFSPWRHNCQNIKIFCLAI